MDILWSPLPNDSVRTTQVFLHKTASIADILDGSAAAPFDLSEFSENVTQSDKQVRIRLRWHLELYGTDQPTNGQIVEIVLDGQRLWVGIIQTVDEYELQHGGKSITIVARSREATSWWKENRSATPVYPVATPLSYIVRDVLEYLGMSEDEMDIPDIPIYTVHSGTQLADLPPWQMLETLLIPAGLEPYIDAYGRFKAVDRDVTRAADIVLTNDRIESVSGGKGQAAVSEVHILWLDPNLTEVSQQGRKLGGATITAGFFQMLQDETIQFSDDNTQRARDTYMIVKQSANSGLVPVCDETYEQKAPTHGEIELRTHWWVPTLATASLAALALTGDVGDAVPVTGYTITVGRRIHAAAEVALLLIMMSIGTGVYEIWGTPYDFVHARNRSIAYNKNARQWEVKPKEIENDLVPDEQTAQSFAVRELAYEYKSASSYNAVIVDDPRIERGDILQLPDGSRLYVTGYERDLTRGVKATLKVEGFRA